MTLEFLNMYLSWILDSLSLNQSRVWENNLKVSKHRLMFLYKLSLED